MCFTRTKFFECSANIIGELFCHNLTDRSAVLFFFCQHDKPESLSARAILGSLIRQCLDANSMPKQIEARLERLCGDSPDCEDLGDFMEDILTVSSEQLIMIDAIDECETSQRDILLSTLRRLKNSRKVKPKIFLTSGLHIGAELKRALHIDHYISMASPEVHTDIKTYIEDVIAERVGNGDLVVGQPQLITEIQKALITGAGGM